jgi:hypothetical protein
MRLRDLVSHAFMNHLERTLPAGAFQRMVDAVAERRIDPHSAANELLNQTLGTR